MSISSRSDNSLDLRNKCSVCGSGDTWLFVEINGLPIHSNILSRTHSEALDVPKGDLEMRCCRDCGHVYNAAFNSRETMYCSDYENSLFFSETYRKYASSLATELVEQFDLHDKKVVEIGCGTGDFLRLLCDKGGNDGIGFDPSAAAGRSIAGHPRITYVRDYYSAKHANYSADMICCRQVLEHVESPLAFLKGIKDVLPAGKKVTLFFEVPDVMFMLKDHSSWDFIYEHCSYFSESSLNRLFTLAGFRVWRIWKTFHDQFLCACIEPLNEAPAESGEGFELEKKEVLRNAEIFQRVYQKQVSVWEQRLQSIQGSGRKVVLWGAGSKGVTFLNKMRMQDIIEYVVDINSQKCGKHIPGTGQQIVPPDFLINYRPDYIILMNPAYETEVRRMVQEMHLNPDVLLVSDTDSDIKWERRT